MDYASGKILHLQLESEVNIDSSVETVPSYNSIVVKSIDGSQNVETITVRSNNNDSGYIQIPFIKENDNGDTIDTTIFGISGEGVVYKYTDGETELKKQDIDINDNLTVSDIITPFNTVNPSTMNVNTPITVSNSVVSLQDIFTTTDNNPENYTIYKNQDNSYSVTYHCMTTKNLNNLNNITFYTNITIDSNNYRIYNDYSSIEDYVSTILSNQLYIQARNELVECIISDIRNGSISPIQNSNVVINVDTSNVETIEGVSFEVFVSQKISETSNNLLDKVNEIKTTMSDASLNMTYQSSDPDMMAEMDSKMSKKMNRKTINQITKQELPQQNQETQS